jgi:hypothetical protein
MLTRIDPDGMVHESAKGADNYNGFGGWTPGLGPFYTAAYTRNRTPLALVSLNCMDEATRAVDFFGRWIMYYPREFPKLQLGGKPVPGHCSVVANKPHTYFDDLRQGGWPTKYTVRDFGNPENDGHGWQMLTRHRAWLKQGGGKAWVDARWDVINESAEYLPWCFENPKLSFVQHGLLHNESEGGMNQQSMYCDFLCWLGLLGHADMAEASGRGEKAVRWRKIAADYLARMEKYYPLDLPPWGDVWDPAKNAGFWYTHSTLAPAFAGIEYWGLDAMNRLPPGWADRTRRTYRMQLSKNQPPFAAPAGLGYGQCYITQTALLLDEMADAAETTEWLARLCFAPRLPRPYLAPEGAVIAGDGSQWRRWGDLGNLYQLTEVVYTIMLLAGIDEHDPTVLTLMPRLPRQCRAVEARDWPVRAASRGQTALVKLTMCTVADPAIGRFRAEVQTDQPLDRARLRAGPFTAHANRITATCNGQPMTTKLFRSGDSAWAWLDFGDGQGRLWTIEVQCK